MEQKRAIHSRLFIIKRESVKEEDKCEYCRLSVRGHVRTSDRERDKKGGGDGDVGYEEREADK